VLLLTAAGMALAGDLDTLGDLRAERRAAVRAAATAKSEGGAPFGLLVIPVDFADARFDSPPALARPLASREPGTLTHYFDVASRGRTRLEPVVSPPVALAGTRDEYSDLGWQGSTRTRRLAREALAGARAAGVVFADADRDGDGEVDGVLILHAAPGLENDPDGWIVPLQFFLAEPVVEAGTVARSYAVASARSTLGIQAHETGHLLGLEDRYDPTLSDNPEVGPRGGLGRFSLMAAGWRGRGEGRAPALPDGYSRWLLGWVDLADSLGAGRVLRLRSRAGGGGDEWFLVERRGDDDVAPYDPDLAPDAALVYHVDEGVPEGAVGGAGDEPPHLRVHLVEADGGDQLRTGVDQGTRDDLFPPGDQAMEFGDGTWPSARWWDGAPSGVHVRLESAGGAAVTVTDLASWFAAAVRLVLPPAGEAGPVDVLVRVEAGQASPADLSVAITPLDEAWGSFVVDGESVTQAVVALAPAPAGRWATHGLAEGLRLSWQPDRPVPDGGVTTFRAEVAGSLAATTIAHPWQRDHAPLALDAAWPGGWTVSADAGATTAWHRWPALPGADATVGPLLACTGAGHDHDADWPEVTYGNGASLAVTTPPLGQGIRWLAFTHAVDVELLRPGVAVDAATLQWVAPDGQAVPAAPLAGWPGHVDPRSGHALAGTPAFAYADSLLPDDRPLWRRELVGLPDPAVHGPGPWRLRFAFASNGVWRGRGWLVRDLTAGTDVALAAPFAPRREGNRLIWGAPSGIEPSGYQVQARPDDAGPWRRVAVTAAQTTEVPFLDLGFATGTRYRVRVLAEAGAVYASRDLALVGGDGAPSLAAPRPNPAHGIMRIACDGAGDEGAALTAFDVRGRLVRRWSVGATAGQVVWDGRDRHGRLVASGVYILRLEAHGGTRTRKVTWLR
jgi:M6 family metalloprotease-like protein